jgi:hemerythrin-like domain-containing protein
VFPRLEKAGKLVELTKTLRAQHVAGRALTADVLKAAGAGNLGDKSRGQAVVTATTSFIRMYRPHAAREDTVLFPAFHELMSEKEWKALGDRFEEREHQVLGKAGFEGVLDEVGQIERTLGIYELSLFTPGATAARR